MGRNLHLGTLGLGMALLVAMPGCRRTRVEGDTGTVTYLDETGRRGSLAEHRGKVVLVDVWATWCPPCRASLPEVAALQKRGGSNFVVVAISVDRGGWQEVRPFLAKHPDMGLQAVVPAEANSLDSLGAVNAIPTTLVLDRRGRIRERWLGHHPGRAEKAIESALAEK